MTEENRTEEAKNDVTKEYRIASYEDMADANAALMSETMNDRRMTTSEKMKLLNLGVRNQAIMTNDQIRRRAEIVRYGIKPNGNMKALNFNPMSEDPA
jgi:hypothetical protein